MLVFSHENIGLKCDNGNSNYHKKRLHLSFKKIKNLRLKIQKINTININ